METTLDQNDQTERAGLSVLQRRLVNFRGPITQQGVLFLINRMLFLAAEEPHEPMLIEINSPGGTLGQALEIVRIMDRVDCPVVTFCRGEARGSALVVAARGRRGFRTAAPGCRFSLWSSSAREGAERPPREMVEVMLKYGGGNLPQLLAHLEDSAEFDPQEALRSGLIDAVSPVPIFPEPAVGAGRRATKSGTVRLS